MLPRAQDWSYRRRRPGPLCERTEGWAAAIALATLALRGRADAAVTAASLSGNQQQIADYLLEEVLDRQLDHLKRFLLGTSILDHMTAPLCDAVLGTTDAAGSLEDLARSNAFVVSLDDHREWYRYHHLFSDLLRGELKRRHPELLPVYLERAADWCGRHGSPGEAFAYAHDAGDLAHAGRIALAYRDEFASRGQIETLRLWLDRCTDAEIESDAQLSIAAAWLFGYLGDAAGAGGSWLRPSGLRSTWRQPTRHLRFARRSRTSEAPWLRTAFRRCCAMPSSADQARTGLRTHTRRAPARPLPGDASLAPGHRRSSSPRALDRQDTRVVDLRQARCHGPIRRCRDHRARRPRIDRSQGHDPASSARLASQCRIAAG